MDEGVLIEFGMDRIHFFAYDLALGYLTIGHKGGAEEFTALGDSVGINFRQSDIADDPAKQVLHEQVHARAFATMRAKKERDPEFAKKLAANAAADAAPGAKPGDKKKDTTTDLFTAVDNHTHLWVAGFNAMEKCLAALISMRLLKWGDFHESVMKACSRWTQQNEAVKTVTVNMTGERAIDK
ncbi:Hypothetical protein A7982_01199 [Minicystis rosea]|nr:Hypothetical protein A7982_01199 [Minicystis rosea]